MIFIDIPLNWITAKKRSSITGSVKASLFLITVYLFVLGSSCVTLFQAQDRIIAAEDVIFAVRVVRIVNPVPVNDKFIAILARL